MLYEPLPGRAAVILVQLGIIEQRQVEALGQRTYDAECGRLSLALDDGRTVELERAMHLQSEDGYAVRIRSRAGQTISRSFIHIDRNLAVRNLHNDRMVYIDDAEYEAAPDFSVLEAIEHQPAEEFTAAPSIDHANDDPSEELQPAPEAQHDAVLTQAAPPPEVLLTQPVPETIQSESVPEPMHAHAAVEPEPEATQPQSEPEPIEYQPVPEASTSSPGSEATEPEFRTTPEPFGEAIPEPALEQLAPADPEPLAAVQAPEPPSKSVSETTAAAAEDLSAQSEPSAVIDAPESQDIVDLIAADPEPAAPEATPAPQSEIVDPLYLPLHESLAAADAAFFDFIAQTGTVHTFEHRETFRYIHIDAVSGLFYDQTRTPISRASAIRHAFTPRVSLAALSAPVAEPEPEPAPTPQAVAEPIPLPEPELRTRSHSLTNGHSRAAIKPDPDPTTPAVPTAGLSFDAFTRKRAQLERDSWRDRIAEISRALRRSRPPTGREDN